MPLLDAAAVAATTFTATISNSSSRRSRAPRARVLAVVCLACCMTGTATGFAPGRSNQVARPTTTALLNTYLQQLDELSAELLTTPPLLAATTAPAGDTSTPTKFANDTGLDQNGHADTSPQYNRMKLQMNLDRQLAVKDAEYQSKIGVIQAANEEEVASMQSKLEKLASEYEAFKLLSVEERQQKAQQPQLAQTATAPVMPAAASIVQPQVAQTVTAPVMPAARLVQPQLAQQPPAMRAASLAQPPMNPAIQDINAAKVREHFQKRMQLEAELGRIEKDYAQAAKTWEKVFNKEHKERAKEQAAAAKELQAIQKQVNVGEQTKMELQLDFQRELTARDAAFKSNTDQLQATKVLEIQVLEARLKKMDLQWKAFKSQWQAEQAVTTTASVRKEEALSRQIVNLQTALEAQKEATAVESEKAQASWQQRVESEQQLFELQKDYSHAVANWKESYTHEQTVRAQEQASAAQALQAIQGLAETREQDKVQIQLNFQRDLATRDANYRNKITQLQDQKATEIKAMQTRLESVSNELQDYKFKTHKEQTEARKVASRQNDALLQQLANLEIALQQQEQATKSESLQVQELWTQRTNLESEVSQLQKDYAKVVQDWEDAYALERQARADDQAAAALQFQSMQGQFHSKEQEKVELQLSLQRELAAKDTTHRNQIESLQATKAAEIQALQDRLERMASEWQEATRSEHTQVVKATEEKLDALSQVITNLQSALKEQQAATRVQSEKATESWNRRQETEKELSQLQKDYLKTVQNWEDGHAREQKARATDKAVAAKQLLVLETALKEEGQTKVKLEEKIRCELAAKDALYQNKLLQVEAAKGEAIMELQDRLEKMSNEWQEYRFSTNREFMTASQNADQAKDALFQQISNLQLVLHDQEELTRKESLKAQEYKDEGIALQADLSQLQRETQVALQTLEAAVAHEQKIRNDERASAAQRYYSLQEEKSRRVREARSDGRQTSERVRIDLTKRLVEKENVILENRIELSEKNVLIAKWSAERASALTMFLQSLHLVRDRIVAIRNRVFTSIVARLGRFKNNVHQKAVAASSRNQQIIMNELANIRESAQSMARDTGTVLVSGSKVALLVAPVAGNVVSKQFANAANTRPTEYYAAVNRETKAFPKSGSKVAAPKKIVIKANTRPTFNSQTLVGANTRSTQQFSALGFI